jgi:AraC family transcriptional regulator of arabinose operon
MSGLKRFFSESPLRTERFVLNGYGIREGMPCGFVNRPNGTGDYLMMYFHTPVRAGTGPDAGDAGAGTLWIWPPGGYQFYGNARRRYLHSWIHCEGTAVRRLLGASRLSLPCAVSGVPAGAILRFLTGLHEEISTQAHPDEVIAENLLENWFRELSRRPVSGEAAVPPRLRKVRDHIDARYASPLTLAELAAMAHWSPAHFSEQFRAAYGVAPMDCVIQARLNHAAHLLGDVNLTVAEVARRVGYDDVYHFSKLFKRHRGHSPGRLRKPQAPPFSPMAE